MYHQDDPAALRDMTMSVIVAVLPIAATSHAVIDDSTWWIWVVVFGPLAASLLLVGLHWYPRRKQFDLHDRLGPANWDFSLSFASNLTVLAAILGTILTAGVLPDTSSAPAGTYAGLNLMFGVLVILGPFVYTATQKVETIHPTQDPGTTAPQYQGYVYGFFLGTVLTLWAVLGELATTGLVFNEIRRGHSMPAIVLWVLVVVLAGGAGFLFLLAHRRITDVLTDQVEHDNDLDKRRKEVQKTLDDPKAEIRAPEPLHLPRREWKVF
jgi:hypothetical protein